MIKSHFRKQSGSPLKGDTEFPNDPAIPLLNIFPRKIKTYVHQEEHMNTYKCTQMVITALFVRTRKSKPVWPFPCLKSSNGLPPPSSYLKQPSSHNMICSPPPPPASSCASLFPLALLSPITLAFLEILKYAGPSAGSMVMPNSFLT